MALHVRMMLILSLKVSLLSKWSNYLVDHFCTHIRCITTSMHVHTNTLTVCQQMSYLCLFNSIFFDQIQYFTFIRWVCGKVKGVSKSIQERRADNSTVMSYPCDISIFHHSCLPYSLGDSNACFSTTRLAFLCVFTFCMVFSFPFSLICRFKVPRCHLYSYICCCYCCCCHVMNRQCIR